MYSSLGLIGDRWGSGTALASVTSRFRAWPFPGQVSLAFFPGCRTQNSWGGVGRGVYSHVIHSPQPSLSLSAARRTVGGFPKELGSWGFFIWALNTKNSWHVVAMAQARHHGRKQKLPPLACGMGLGPQLGTVPEDRGARLVLGCQVLVFP